MTNKEKYKILCETEGPEIPLFLQYWWMETVCQGKQWDVLLSLDNAGEIRGALPYLWGKKCGLRYVLQPQLTQYNGPWIHPDADTKAVTANLVFQLQNLHLSVYLQNFAPTLSTEGWESFDCSERKTYRIEDISNTEEVFAHFDKSRRQRQIHRAEKKLHPIEITPEDFALFHEQYWLRRGKKDLLSREFMLHVISESLKRDQGILLGLADTEGRLVAARFVVFDRHCAYALLSALSEDHPNGASPMLFWEIIQRLSSRTRSFDFEGSMEPSIAYSYSLYGAQPATYHQVMRCANPLIKKLFSLIK